MYPDAANFFFEEASGFQRDMTIGIVRGSSLKLEAANIANFIAASLFWLGSFEGTGRLKVDFRVAARIPALP